MKITGTEQFVVDGGWDRWVFLKVTTDSGLTGWAEFSQERARRGLPLLVAQMCGDLLGKDPRQVGLISAQLRARYRSAGSGLRAMAIGAIQNACLDIAAKALGVPVHGLFGGALRDRLPLYWSHCGLQRAKRPDLFGSLIDAQAVRDLDDVRRLGEEVAQRGFKALKTNLLPLGTAPAPMAERALDRDTLFRLRDQMEAFRDGGRGEVRLMLDVNFAFRPEGLRRIAREMEPLDLMWLEADCEEPAELAALRQSSATPIGSLETVLGVRALRPYLDRQAVDFAIIDPVFNGLAEALQMAALADAHDVAVAAHNSHGPLGTLIAAQFCALIPNMRYLEYDVDGVPWRGDLLSRTPVVDQGEMQLPTGPGWGADLVQEVASAHAG